MYSICEKKSTSSCLAGAEGALATAGRPNGGGTVALTRPLEIEDGKGEPAPTARSRCEDGRGGAAAPRLDKRTHLDEATYRVKLTDYGNGIAEVGWSFIPALKSKPSAKGKSEAREANDDRAERRAKSRIRKLVLSSGADHLLTLTYRENVTDLIRANDDFSRFIRIVKGQVPQWPYIAVPERQERGAWHWHLAVRGRQDVGLLREAWRRVVGEGNIDVKPPTGKGNQRQLALIRYLAKYITKGFESDDRQLNGRRFRSSLGIEVPLQYLTVPEGHSGGLALYALTRLVDATGSVGYYWESPDKTAGWACSWK